MTLPQTLSILTLVGMMALFIWGRFRYDVTAILALMAALALGIVKPEDAFTGFSDDIVIIVGSALVIRSEEQTFEIQSLMRISYAVFRMKKKILVIQTTRTRQTLGIRGLSHSCT